jgi:hypothetical protein
MVPTKKIFLFLYFSFRNAQGYPHEKWAYAQRVLLYPQFKKVFSYFPIYIHTTCAQRFSPKYFVGITKPQNAPQLHFEVSAFVFKPPKAHCQCF